MKISWSIEMHLFSSWNNEIGFSVFLLWRFETTQSVDKNLRRRFLSFEMMLIKIKQINPEFRYVGFFTASTLNEISFRFSSIDSRKLTRKFLSAILISFSHLTNVSRSYRNERELMEPTIILLMTKHFRQTIRKTRDSSLFSVEKTLQRSWFVRSNVNVNSLFSSNRQNPIARMTEWFIVLEKKQFHSRRSTLSSD